jgi:hypothetical protein
MTGRMMTPAEIANLDNATAEVTPYATFAEFMRRCAVNDHAPILSHDGRAWEVLRDAFAVRGLTYR